MSGIELRFGRHSIFIECKNLMQKEPKINIYIMNPKKKNKDNNKKRYDELCWISTRDVYEKMEPMDLDP